MQQKQNHYEKKKEVPNLVTLISYAESPEGKEWALMFTSLMSGAKKVLQMPLQ